MDPLLTIPAVAAGLFSGGFLLHRLLIGRIAAAPEHLRTLATLGIALILSAGLAVLPGTAPAGIAIAGTASNVAIGPFLFGRVELHAALMAGIVTALLVLFFNLTRTGKAIRACADNPFGARVIGLNLKRLQAATFGLGAAIAGVAGCLLVQSEGVRPDEASGFLVLGLIVALAGGLGSVEGALLGGAAVGVAEALAGALLAPPLKDLSGYAVILLVLLLRPYGLLRRSE